MESEHNGDGWLVKFWRLHWKFVFILISFENYANIFFVGAKCMIANKCFTRVLVSDGEIDMCCTPIPMLVLAWAKAWAERQKHGRVWDCVCLVAQVHREWSNARQLSFDVELAATSVRLIKQERKQQEEDMMKRKSSAESDFLILNQL